MTNIIVRVDLGEAGRIGPGKMQLLELIAQHGSISAAGRAMRLPYRHAWELVDQLNATFEQPVVARQTGGRNGGGASLTAFGETLLAELLGLKQDAERAAAVRLAAIGAAVRKDLPTAAADDGEATRSGGAKARSTD